MITLVCPAAAAMPALYELMQSNYRNADTSSSPRWHVHNMTANLHRFHL